MYTAQLVQERGTAAQHFCCHGEHGFRCLHRRGNRDLLNRYTAVAAADDGGGGGGDDDDVTRCINSTCSLQPAQEVIYTSTVSQAADEGSYCD